MAKSRVVDDIIDLQKPTDKTKNEHKWIYDRPGHWKCSNCGYMEGRISQTEYRTFCPVCGTKLR